MIPDVKSYRYSIGKEEKIYIKAWLNVSDEQGVLWWHTKIRCHQHFVTSVTYFGCWVLRMNAATNNA